MSLHDKTLTEVSSLKSQTARLTPNKALAGPCVYAGLSEKLRVELHATFLTPLLQKIVLTDVGSGIGQSQWRREWFIDMAGGVIPQIPKCHDTQILVQGRRPILADQPFKQQKGYLVIS